MIKNVDSILDLAAKISVARENAKKANAEVEELTNQLQQLLNSKMESPSVKETAPSSIPNYTNVKLSNKDRIYKFLELHSNKSFRTSDLMKNLKINNYSVRWSLSTLVKEKKVQRVAEGLYQIKK